jgi:osmoprotectant transport system permease protein
MRPVLPLLLLLLGGCMPAAEPGPEPPYVKVGSKVFTESVVLGDIVAGLARDAGADATYQKTRSLGSTRVLWDALLAGEVDVYVEYTGTIGQEILAGRGLKDEDAIRRALGRMGIRMSKSLGFNNTYAIGMADRRAEQLTIHTISDLKNHPVLRLGFSNEFMDRGDGWKGLKARYQLTQRDVRGLDHELAYRGLLEGTLDATDLYSTDAKIRRYHLRVLQDDLGYFPAYQAVLVYRDELATRAPQVVEELLKLQGSITEATMIDMNARVDLDGAKETEVAADFLREHFGIQSETADEGMTGVLLLATGQHLFLVGVSLLAAIIVSIPLGIFAAKRPAVGQVILAASGLVQTIPSLALLVFMIPLFGLFAPPAIAALFLYSLLPIVRNTYTGLREIPLHVRESAEALGLSALARLRLVELPLASATILAGIKTAAVINVGTATLGGFIGAGGFGQLIFSGLRKGDNALTLQGAVPAALLALAVQGIFELVERFLVPRGLRLRRID